MAMGAKRLGSTRSTDLRRATADSALSSSASQLVKPCCRATARRASSSVAVAARTSSIGAP
jgi:hypothetical protein